jgi:spore germination protein YaaH
MTRLLPIVTLFLVTFTSAAQAPPISAHHRDWLAHRDAPTARVLIDGPLPTAASRETGRVGQPCRTIFGYLPYWENPTPLRWDLLTHLACFSVEVNANGTLGNLHGWPWTATVNTAHANGVKVILVVTLFDSASINTLITTPSYKQAFFANIKQQLLIGNADGLNIDFETGTTWQDDINTFMADLSAYLRTDIPDCEVTIAGPAVDWSNSWDLPGLAASCDGIFIMGYAFAGSWSSLSGPNAPLVGGSINITNTVDVQYAGVPRDKMILGVPYYGHHWRTADSTARSSVTAFLSSTRFHNDQPNADFYGRQWHATSQTPWYRWFESGQWHQVWYDDAESLGLKYQLALDRGLQGVGMWALGYDEGRDELWDQLELQFGGCERACDIDGDGDCDNMDVSLYTFCIAGPDMTFGDGHTCRNRDLDLDTDVDVADVALYQLEWAE